MSFSTPLPVERAYICFLGVYLKMRASWRKRLEQGAQILARDKADASRCSHDGKAVEVPNVLEHGN